MEFKIKIGRDWLQALQQLQHSSSSGEDNLEPEHKFQNYRTPFLPEHKAKDKYEHWPIVDD